MAENTTGAKPWEPGQSGNPGGRPKMPPELLQRLRDFTPRVIEIWQEIANDTRLKPEPRLRATELIAERAYGKPPQDLNLGGQPDNPFIVARPLAGLTAEQIEEIERMLSEAQPESNLLD